MTCKLPMLWVCILFLGCYSQRNQPIVTVDYQRFQNPINEDRSTLFYSLNDDLDNTVLKQQIVDFARGGVGGVFFHAREGLKTQYFSKDWWDAIDAGVEQSMLSGIDPWFYDEYKWPSGYATGHVPAKNKDFRGKYLARIATYISM